jgi:hypothetical protein
MLLASSAHFVFGEDFPVIFTLNEPYIQHTTYTKSHLSTMINNALIGSPDTQTNLSHEPFKEQFISIESLDYNNKMIFEDSSKQTSLLAANNVPFILPVPFP